MKKIPIKAIFGTCQKVFWSLLLGVATSWIFIALVVVRKSIISPTWSNRLSLLFPIVLGVLFYVLFKWLTSVIAIKQRVLFFVILLCFVTSFFLVDLAPNKWFEGSYLPLFQPKNTFRIVVNHSQGSLPESVNLSWATGLYGDISFQSFTMNGWQVTDTGVAVQAEENWLEWSGVTGSRLTLVFKPVVPGSEIKIFWNQAPEPEIWKVNGADQLIIHKDFDMPFQATSNFIKTLLILDMTGLWSIVIALISYSITRIAFVNEHVNTILESTNRKLKKLIGAWNASIERQLDHSDSKLLRRDFLIMACLVLATTLFRVINLDTLALTYDEYFHLQAAKDLLNGMSLSEVYSRSLYIVTLPITLTGSLFGVNIFSARLPGVIASALAIVPLYLICIQYGRRVAILACFLLMTHPLLTAMARMAREYAYQPVIFFFVVLAMQFILRQAPKGMIILRDVGKLINKKTIISILFLLVVAVYSLAIDRFSTFRIILPAYALFILFLALRINYRNISNLAILAIVLILGSWLLSRYWTFIDNFGIDANLAFYQLTGFTSSSVENWYYLMPVLLPILAFAISFWVAIVYRKKSDSLIFIVMLVVMYLVLFNSIFSDAYRNRYTLSIYYWIIILFAFGFSIILSVFWANVKRMLLKAIILIGLLASFINISQVIKPITFSGEFLDITNLSYYKMEYVDSYIRRHQLPADGLVSTVYFKYIYLLDPSQFAGLEYYSWQSDNPTQEIYEKMTLYDTGWVVLDHARGLQLSQPLPLEDTTLYDIDVKYIGEFDSQYVWYWKKSLPLISPSNRLSNQEN